MNSLHASRFLKMALAVSSFFLVNLEALAQGTNFRTGWPSTNALTARSSNLHKTNALVSRPGTSQDFSFTMAGNYNHTINSSYTYDSQGRLLQRLYTDPVSNQLVQRLIRSYNAQGDNTEIRHEVLNNGVWQPFFADRYLITYNNSGQKLETILQGPDPGSNPVNWTYVNSSREKISYGANGKPDTVTYSSWTNNSWLPVSRMNFTYPAGTGATAIIQNYISGTWQTKYRRTNLEWFIPFMIPKSYVDEGLINGSWVFSERYNSVYDTNRGYVGIKQRWDGGAWINKFRESETYDANGNFTSSKTESWNPTTNSWQATHEWIDSLTYSGIDITERIFLSWNINSGTTTNYGKEVYSNFLTFSISGVKELPALAVNVYPNPAHETISISFPEHKGDISAMVTDLTGKTLLTRNFRTGEVTSLNIATLPEGIYLLHLETSKGKTVQKIIKN